MDFVGILIILVVILVSMTIHEAMHAFVSYFLGDDTAKAQGRLTFNPIKHIDPFMTVILPVLLALTGGPIFGGAKPVPFNPTRLKYDEWGVALVAIAGPLTNLLIAFVAYGTGMILGIIDNGMIERSLVGQIFQLVIGVNIGFFAFNILPIPPLDGSRVLYVLAPSPVRRTMDLIETYGVFVIFALVLLAPRTIGSVMGLIIDSVLQLFTIIF